MLRPVLTALLLAVLARAQDSLPLKERARQYLIDLIRIDTSSPPGNETRAAEYLKRVADANGIGSELLGGDPQRLNFVARLRGSGGAPGARRPLLLMAHTDVVPAERDQWTVDPFAALIRDGFIYGRGAQDDKSVLAAELAVLVELKRRDVKLDRDVILLAESGEEGVQAEVGIQWMIRQAFDKIDAEFALNEGGAARDLPSGVRLFLIQTTEKIPTRVTLTARGSAGHGSLPRPDNPVAHLARAITRLVDAEQPVKINETTRRYFQELAKMPDYAWLAPLVPKLEASAGAIRARDPDLDAAMRTTVSPTILRAGMKINVIPNIAEAQIDVRRLPNETKDDILARFRQIISDPAVEVAPIGADRPATEPSSLTTALYRAMEQTFHQAHPRAAVVPFMQRGSTDGANLRAKGMAVYGVPLFVENESRSHGNDERISIAGFEAGTGLLWRIVTDVAGR